MIKAVLFDGDGVTIIPPAMFSIRYEEDFGLPVGFMQPFFKGEFQDCLRGQRDLKEILPNYLKTWKWPGEINGFLKYWFDVENVPNKEVIAIIKAIRKNGVRCYLVSNQEKYRKEYIINDMGFGKLFDQMFFSCDLGCVKSENEFFLKVFHLINFNEKFCKNEIMYWDDNTKEVQKGEDFGFQARQYKNINDLKQLV